MGERTDRVIKNTGFLFLRMLLTLAIGLFTSREIMRILGVQDYGLYNLVGTLVVMFAFLQTALTNATSRYLTFDLGAGDPDKLQKTFSMSMNIELVLSAIVIVLSEAVGPWFIYHYLDIPADRVGAAMWVYQISLLNFVAGIIRTPFNSLVIAHEKMDYFALTSIIDAVGRLAIVYLLLITPIDKLIAYAIYLTLLTLALLIWMWLFCRKHFAECRYTRYWDRALFFKLLGYSGYSLLVNGADTAVKQGISIFFNKFGGLVANAGLGIATNVQNKMWSFLLSFGQSYSPQIIKSYAAGDRDYFMKLIYSAGKFSYFLYFLVAFPIMLNVDYLLDLWLVEVPENAGLFVNLMIGFSIFESFSNPLVTAVHATGNLKVHQIMISCIKITVLPVSFILLRHGHPVSSVLVVYMLTNLVCAVARIIWMHYLIGLDIKDYCVKVMWRIIYVTALSVMVPLLIASRLDSPLTKLLITSAVFVAVFAAVIYFTGMDTSEKEIFGGLVRKVLPNSFKRYNR